MTEQWQELKETIIELRDNDGTCTQQEVCRFLVSYMDILEKQIQEPKTGYWEWLTEDKYRCSNCKHETRVDECMSKPMYDFCPFCRARMESED